MILKVLLLSLVVLIAVSQWGRLRPRRRPAQFCAACGRPLNGRPCVCGEG